MQHDDARQAQLVAAAEALVAWMHTRRAAWADLADYEPDAPQAPMVAPPAAPVFVAPPVPEAPPFTLPPELPTAWEPPPAAFEPASDTSFAAAPAPFELPAESPYSPRPEISFSSVAPSAAVEPAKPKEPFKLPLAALGRMVGSLGSVMGSLRSVAGSLGSTAGTLGSTAGSLGSAAGSLVQRSMRPLAITAVLAVVAGGAWKARPYIQERFTPPKSGTAVIESLPSSEVVVDGESYGASPVTAELSTGRHVVEFRRRNEVRTMEIDVVGGQSTTARVDWDAVQKGRLMARSDPAGAKVLVDGKERGVTPLTLDDVPVGPRVVVIQNDQGSVRRTVTVAVDRVASVSESIFPGWLKVFVPFEVRVSEGTRAHRLDDQSQILLPPGSHELRFENTAFGYSDTRRVDIEPGQTTRLSIVPAPSRLSVVANGPATVIVDGQQVGETPLTDQPIALGTRDIVVRSAEGQEKRFTTMVTVAPVRLDVSF